MWESENITKERLIKEAVEEIDFSRDLSDEELFRVIDDSFEKVGSRWQIPLEKRIEMRKEAFNSLRKLDCLQEFLDDDTVTEIMINGKDNIFIERNGKVEKIDKGFTSEKKLEDVIQQIVAGCNRRVNEANPIQDARLPTGERISIVLPPVALNGPIVTIRKFSKTPLDMETLVSLNSLSYEAAEFLKKLVISKYNIFISGGTGSGKTTFLNALSQFIPEDERIITIEDSAELKLMGIKNLVRLETRNRTEDGAGEISIRDLIRASLRMRPERIIVGECRGEEAIDMLQAMNTGHDGSLSTGHANSSIDMIKRLETMALSGMDIPVAAIRSQIGSAIDVIVHLTRMQDKSRRVEEISEIVGIKNGELMLNRIFELRREGFIKVGELKNKSKLIKAGLCNGL